jgi:hypothetical protein
MTALAVTAALVTALCIGYHVGRRAGSTPCTWKNRTSRIALSKRTFSLVVWVIARRVQRNSLIQRVLTNAVSAWCLKSVEPHKLLRRDLPRRRANGRVRLRS